MPLAYRLDCPNAFGGVWKIEETVDELSATIPQVKADAENACRLFASAKRQLEYVAVRALVYTLLRRYPAICYKESGKPYLADRSLFLSVSHTAGYAAVLFSEKYEVGIDIERVSERVMNIRQRFLASDEKPETLYPILLHWSAKETVFKIIDEENIEFSRHFHVSGLEEGCFEQKKEETGQFRLTCQKTDQQFKIYYKTTADHVLTYAVSDQIRL